MRGLGLVADFKHQLGLRKGSIQQEQSKTPPTLFVLFENWMALSNDQNKLNPMPNKHRRCQCVCVCLTQPFMGLRRFRGHKEPSHFSGSIWRQSHIPSPPKVPKGKTGVKEHQQAGINFNNGPSGSHHENIQAQI